jgi:hypothetical protein
MVGAPDSMHPTNPLPEPEDFDVAFQPPLLGNTHLMDELAKACIAVRDVPFSEWQITENHPSFQRNATTPIPAFDLDGKNEPNFWVLYALSAYEGSDDQDCDPDFPKERGEFGNSEGFVRVYCETIRDDRHVLLKQPTPPPTLQDYSVILQRNLTHEVLHCFLGRHAYKTPIPSWSQETEIDSDHYTNKGIMEKTADFTALPINYVLSAEQIQHIQANDNPKPL